MKVLGSTENKMTKGKMWKCWKAENGENVPYFEIIGVVLVYWNIANNESNIFKWNHTNFKKI